MNLLYKLFEKLLGKNTLYYPGCFTKKMLPEIEKNYEKILNDLGVNFIKLKDFEYCCGSPILKAGMKKDFEEIKNKNIEIFKNHQVGLIITNCPACFNMFKFEYKLADYGIEVEHITQTINKKQKIKNKKQKDIFYHDPCHLGRLSNIYNEPRDILRNSGYNVCEFSKNRENSLCCGGGGGLVNNNPELSKQIAKETLSQIPNDSTITSPCPMCFYQFKNNNTENISIKEFSEIILDQDGK